MTAMIEAKDLVQVFTTRRGKEKTQVRAVNGVTLDVQEGEVVGFLGPNGAGKTTTMRMLTTLLKPTSGTAKVAGYDVVREQEQVRRSIGYVSQAGGTFSGAQAGDEVVDHAMLYGIRKADAVKRGHELFESLHLEGLWKRTPKKMSGGQKRRLDIVMGLIHDPNLVFLDEPTTGLDPQARANLWQHIEGLRTNHGATILLTTHYMDEADALSDRIIIIDKGTIVASDSPENLKKSVSGDLVKLQVPAEHIAATSARLQPLATSLDVDGSIVSGRVADSGRFIPGLLRHLDSEGIGLQSIEIIRPTLDDVFLTLTGRSLRDAEEGFGAESTTIPPSPAGAR